ncbi:unnamed protein product [Parnassius mnemosyne]|uniref:Uncharacterized protein n=1 Tax=Parnassius mnemosyne TaxID=213953 RepID=A0AAV1LM02_9NEOP
MSKDNRNEDKNIKIYAVNLNEHIKTKEFIIMTDHLDNEKKIEIEKIIKEYRTIFAKDNTLDLAGRILKAPAGINCKIACLDEATNAWLAGPSPNLPSKPHKQRAWDTIASVATLQTLIEPSTGRDWARLLAVSKPESGYWLQAYPSPNTGTFINPDTLRIAVGLRLGAGICTGHNCVSCGTPVDRLGHHGLSCTSGAGRLSRHAALNDILRRALVSANVPVALEPQIVRSDGKRPDGMSLIPWKSGRALVWDATCTDTLAASYLPVTTKRAGAAADARERLKVSKYSCLGAQYQFFCFRRRDTRSLGQRCAGSPQGAQKKVEGGNRRPSRRRLSRAKNCNRSSTRECCLRDGHPAKRPRPLI